MHPYPDRQTAPPPKAGRLHHLRALAWTAIALLAAGRVCAIESHEIELGYGGAYDGRVVVTRDAAGRMILRDAQMTTGVALNDLRYAGRDHGLLQGLGDDDHPQYFNASRLGASVMAILGRWTFGEIGAGLADIDNLRLDGNALSNTNLDGGITLSPRNGTVAVTGQLSVNGQPLSNPSNLLDNPDFSIWQRNISQACAAGGNAAGSITWPVPGTLNTGADRWQISRARTDMMTTVSRTLLLSGVMGGHSVLREDYAGGSPDCRQFIHQTVAREVTRHLRGRWVTFAISHYFESYSGTAGIAIYKTVSGSPIELARQSFTGAPNAWERVALSAQVPSDAECLLVSIDGTLSASGPLRHFMTNAVLVEGRAVVGFERVTLPAESRVPSVPKSPARDLADCQRFYERGALGGTFYSPNAMSNTYTGFVAFNQAKHGTCTITIEGPASPLIGATIAKYEKPAFVAGRYFPQGFQWIIQGSLAAPGLFNVNAEWVASCAEPL